MATQEFYVRNANETEARGPFTREQLTSLGEAEQLTPQSLYYETDVEQWVPIDSNPALKAIIFPEKKKLAVKAKEKIATLNVQQEGDAPITVEHMLAAATGQTVDTADKKDPQIAQARAATIGLYSIVVALLASASGLLLPFAEVLGQGEMAKLVTEPFIILGIADLILGIFILLQVTTLYPLVRFRAALGLGFLGFFFWAEREPTVALAIAIGSVGLYFSTIFVRYVPILVSLALCVVGMGGFAYLMLK